MTEPSWVTFARADMNLSETPGKLTTPKIQRWLIELGAWWRDDETPWCGVAVGAWMKQAGYEIPKHFYRARAWLDWGRPCQAVVGAVVIFERGASGHVGLLVGIDQNGRFLVLGGNQGNKVSIAPFEHARVMGFRWPLDVPMSFGKMLATSQSNDKSSSGEA